MAEDDLDRDLARRFADLRAAEEVRTPAFRRVLARARPAGVPSRGRRAGLLAAAAGAALVAAAILLRPPTGPARPIASGTAIAEWKSPTAALLETPGSEIYGEPPPAAAPLPDWALDAEPQAAPAPSPSTPRQKGASS